MTTPLIELRGLDLERVGCDILRGLDWTVMPGEHWTVLGPNGCGKTTLMATLTAHGDVGPTRFERMRLFDKQYGTTHWHDLRRRVGLVSQAIALRFEPDLTAEEAVATGMDGGTMNWELVPPARRRRARRLLADCGARSIAARRWAVLSQGERQRVLIARALIARPKLLILDEPCAGLDPVARHRFLGDLQALLSQPSCPTCLLITHHVEEIIPAISHALVLGQGRRVAAGPLRQALTSTHLSTAFAAPVQVSRRAGTWRLQVAEQD